MRSSFDGKTIVDRWASVVKCAATQARCDLDHTIVDAVTFLLAVLQELVIYSYYHPNVHRYGYKIVPRLGKMYD